MLGRCRWFIRLRWVVVATLILLLAANDAWMKYQRSTLPIWVIAGLIALYNLAFAEYVRRRLNFCLIGPAPPIRHRIAVCASAQMVTDITALTALLRYSGGIENPLSFFYIFHMILASILLTRRASYAVATLAIITFASLALGELSGLIAPHYGFLGNVLELPGLYRSPLYVGGYLAKAI